MDKKICCVILAAGLSSRMGDFKPLLPINGVPAIRFLAEHFFSAGADACVIVTGHNAEQLREALNDLPDIIWGFNPDYASTGMFESAKIGFSLVPENCGRILLTPADIPLVKEETIRQLMDSDDPLLFPSYRFRKGHPVAFAGHLLPALLKYNRDSGLRGAFQSLPVRESFLETDDPGILMDMDTPEDYQKLLAFEQTP